MNLFWILHIQYVENKTDMRTESTKTCQALGVPQFLKVAALADSNCAVCGEFALNRYINSSPHPHIKTFNFKLEFYFALMHGNSLMSTL